MYPILKKYKGDGNSYVVFSAPSVGTLVNTEDKELKSSLFVNYQIWDEKHFEEV